MRLVAGGAAIHFALSGGWTVSELLRVVPQIVGVGAGSLLLLGLWTPVAGVLIALLALWTAYSAPGELWTSALLGAVGAGLAMIGPGAWSIDARLFGRERIDVQRRE